MEQYYVEGLFANKQGVKKARKTGSLPLSSIEPFARTIWANSPDEAIRLATQELDGGEWTEGPRVSRMSEEQRMRDLGAPQLPGFGPAAKKKRK
jgi:hypothetical protein